MGTINPSYLIDDVRLSIGDIDPVNYRYTDAWLTTSLLASIKTLARWWNRKYIVSANLVSRNTALPIYPNMASWLFFYDEEPPVIQFDDERPIVLMASIIILEGSLENNAWNLGSWRDAEISYSNIESGRVRDLNIKRLWDELMSLITPPTKKLARTTRGELPGYKNNVYEQKGKY